MVWDFFQNEILGMHWLNRLVGSGLQAFGLDTTSKIGGTIQFFIYDTIKIMVLLGVLIWMISYIQSYFPPERSKKILGRFQGTGANIIAALLGTVTPFCSCSSIPLFIGFTNAGLSLGVTFSFLISSPNTFTFVPSISAFFSNGRSCFFAASYEYLRMESGRHLCIVRIDHCCRRRHLDRET